MKLNFRTIALVALCSLAGVAWSASKLDPRLHMLASAPPELVQASKGIMLDATVAASPRVSAFVKVRDVDSVSAAIRQSGGVVRTRVGQIVTASLPVASLHELAARGDVVYIEADVPVRAKLDESVPLIDADDVHDADLADAAGLPQAYTGSGVIVGVVDSGLDCDHTDWDDGNGDSRVLAYWDQTLGSGGVSEVTGSSGTEYTGLTITNGDCVNSPDLELHGTHVTGIAASSHETFTGLAPAASIIAVKHNATDADSGGTFATRVVEGVSYIFKKAQAQSPKMPAVVNLSIGTSLGAHDGTSLFEQSLDALLIESGSTEKQGRAIVNAAGNENFRASSSLADDFGGIHATIDQDSGSTGYAFIIGVDNSFSNASTVFNAVDEVFVDIWLDAGSDCTLQVDATAQDDQEDVRINMAPVALGGSTTAATNSDGAIDIALAFTDTDNANNGKQHAVATIARTSGSSDSVEDYSFDLIVTGDCSGDAWLYPDIADATAFRKASALSVATHSAGYTYSDGDSDRTLTIPSTATKVIGVASFEVATPGVISDFSSLGPTADGRVKPDISAPGEFITATRANGAKLSTAGTSMSSPHVAGTVALMLERNGCLNAAQIKTALTDTAISDGSTGNSLPNNEWGAGKLNTLAAVEAVSASSCIPDNASENDDDDDDDSSGGGGCALLKPLS